MLSIYHINTPMSAKQITMMQQKFNGAISITSLFWVASLSFSTRTTSFPLGFHCLKTRTGPWAPHGSELLET